MHLIEQLKYPFKEFIKILFVPVYMIRTLMNFGSFFSTTISTTQAGTVSLRRTPSVSPPASRASNLIQDVGSIWMSLFLRSNITISKSASAQVISKVYLYRVLPPTSHLEIFVPVSCPGSVCTLKYENCQTSNLGF